MAAHQLKEHRQQRTVCLAIRSGRIPERVENHAIFVPASISSSTFRGMVGLPCFKPEQPKVRSDGKKLGLDVISNLGVAFY